MAKKNDRFRQLLKQVDDTFDAGQMPETALLDELARTGSQFRPDVQKRMERLLIEKVRTRSETKISDDMQSYALASPLRRTRSRARPATRRIPIITFAAILTTVLLAGFLLLNLGGNDSLSVSLIRSREEINRDAFTRYIDEAWNSGNLDVLGEVFAPEYVRHDPLLSGEAADLERERALITNFRSALPDLHVRIQNISADGNKVWAQLAITGTHTASFEIADGRLASPSGNSLSWTITSLSRMEDGKIVEIWMGSDTLEFMRQLGVYVGLQITIPDGDVEALIAAINAANDETANPGPDTITLAENGVYTLTEAAASDVGGNGLPLITSPITINGNGATIQRSSDDDTPDFRVLYVGEGGDLRLNDVTISNGSIPDGTGGGIWNREGQLTVRGSTFTGNIAGISGGGIANHGVTTISDSTFSENQSGAGGGIGNRSGGQLTISDSTFTNNTANFSNAFGNGTGGGVDNRDGGQVTINGSAFFDNTAHCAGGADNVGEMTIINSTFSGNATVSCGGGVGNAGTATIINSTIVGNSADPDEGFGGIGAAGTLTIKNTIVADNGDGDDCDGLRGTFTAVGDNLSTDGTCPGFTNVTTDALNLGPLADNGGPTQTHALLPGSVAIDAAGDCTDTDDNPLAFDQRGMDRLQGDACDVGAFEASDVDSEQ